MTNGLSPLRKMKYCSQCGKKLTKDDAFCSKCGKKILGKVSDTHKTPDYVLSGNDAFGTVLTVMLVLSIFLILGAVMVFVVKFPYQGTVYYLEEVPFTVEECKRDISLNPTAYVTRGLNNLEELLAGDVNVLLEECENVVRTKQVSRQNTVTKYATLWEQWQNK